MTTTTTTTYSADVDVVAAAAARYERQYEVVVDQLPGFLHRLVDSVTNSVLARHQHTALSVTTATAPEVIHAHTAMIWAQGKGTGCIG